ncbi:hypothetical protein LOK74_09965 [Brevibacillus humidisoli]|uniref:hypothetical protein n=1 Tax=Brevibacillus humidisoli TaxID=2895522 RepID=UPI001E31CD54|nr:hypothetical protein [Brevibacillus humidisoli]UFJ42790.1 hypothetical protein LOK74_09965 [Brevibacillus humidisoli]
MHQKLWTKLRMSLLASTIVFSASLPAAAWDGVSAYATISFSEGSDYYIANGTGKVYGSGSNTGDQLLVNVTHFTSDAYFVGSNEESGTSSPVTQTLKSDREGDRITWALTVRGMVWEGGRYEYSDKDSDEKTHPGI